jgi:ribosomal protein S18 acetylase RimI-like enzyme
MEIQRVSAVTDELVAAFGRLIPQLSTARPPTRAELEELVASPACTLFVALIPEIVGSLALGVYRSPAGVHAWIEDVIVEAAARGRGIGEALTLAGIQRAREAGAHEVNLTSSPAREAANRLYQRLGFQLRATNVYRFPLDENR